MSDLISLAARPRTVIGKKVSQLRRQGITPIVVYGHSFSPVELEVDSKALLKALRAAGTSRLITLSVDGEKRPRMTILRDVQRHPTRLDVLHADLLQVAMDQTVRSEIPLDFSGEPLLAERHEALVDYELSTLTIEALPGDLPATIAVDLTRLVQVHDTITVAGLDTAGRFQVMQDPETVIARLLPVSRGAEAAEEEAPEAAAEPEATAQRGRQDDE